MQRQTGTEPPAESAEQPAIKQEKPVLKGKSWKVGSMNSAAKTQTLISMSKATRDIEARSLENEIDNSFVPKFTQGETYDPFDFSLTKLRIDQRNQYNNSNSTSRRIYKGVGGRGFGGASRFNGRDPLDFWRYPEVLTDFITTNGKIIPGHSLGNNGKTQRRVAKAIRRARAAGLLSYFHPVNRHL
ncbi:hypothetical protein DV451_002376 [Geotrichum candidum]|uniref:Small ribosomal subunit protein bS18m n=1 Tax=Geotrichum candidum TaxID=1173061 RepID=A0A9P5G701_GEOCN|nr:hypothetical protein DV451_002376 [Geotrichum candidum]KAF5106079.1 hypothetical protein DV453_004257 [Geotrichum candidum]